MTNAQGAAESAAAAYDALAELYARHWGPALRDDLLPALDALVLGDLPPGAAVMDLCCGTGDVAASLAARGLQVTGVDGSAAMLRHAHRRAPHVRWVRADARELDMPGRFHAVISTFDSLNHLLEPEELADVLGRVRAAIRDEGGWFAFDLNTERAYRERWDDAFSVVDDDLVGIMRVRFLPADARGVFEATVFRIDAGGAGLWHRDDLSLAQRPYEVDEVTPMLRAAGFADVAAHDAEDDLGLVGHTGRVVFVCRAAGRQRT